MYGRIVASFAALCLLSAVPHAQPIEPHTAPADDDTYTFRDGSSHSVSVVLEPSDAAQAFSWPELSGAAWDSALLRVAARARDEGPLPFIEIGANGVSERQFFRPGDAGLRWLNLAPLRGQVKAGDRVTLRGDGVDLLTGAATLRLFANRIDLSRPTLVLAPHPDDAEIAAFGIYARRRSTIVTVTTGNAGPASYEAVVSDLPEMYRLKGRLRVIDSVTVPWIGGIPPDRAFNLGYFDARLAEMHDAPTRIVPEMYGPNTDIGVYLQHNIGSLLPKRPRASTWTNLVDDFERVLRKVKPAVIVAPHPQLDTHRDHQFTMVALAQAMARWRKDVSLLLYTNHADQNRYPYGPAGTLMSLPPPLPRAVLLDRVYSHAVSPELQRLKLFALEAMHDLRPSPSRIYQLVIGDDRSSVPEKHGPSSVGGVNYLRRGPRANELFYVYDQESVRPMVDAFLQAWRTRPTP
jgi:LmbE family N-acetylglucosaminyl deacetylase